MDDEQADKFREQRKRTLGKKFLKKEDQNEIKEEDIWGMIEKLKLQSKL